MEVVQSCLHEEEIITTQYICNALCIFIIYCIRKRTTTKCDITEGWVSHDRQPQLDKERCHYEVCHYRGLCKWWEATPILIKAIDGQLTVWWDELLLVTVGRARGSPTLWATSTFPPVHNLNLKLLRITTRSHPELFAQRTFQHKKVKNQVRNPETINENKGWASTPARITSRGAPQSHIGLHIGSMWSSFSLFRN